MTNPSGDDQDALAVESFRIAKRWCEARGPDWQVITEAGRGGTAPVYAISSPSGPRALKIYDLRFSSGEEGEIQSARVQMQVELGDHGCPYLVKVYEGGQFEDRLYVLMSLAPGGELEKRLKDVPRSNIRTIIDQIAKAAKFLEDIGLCHRDIKSANIFISDDFEQATLLDVSVLREINDPVGVGTDHGDKLPMIATARYSPPEYLFRLLDPSPESWHALNIYQIGTVLHDLINREPMFESEYKASRNNRYRFAWIVATASPKVESEDVDKDLIDLSRRALNKNWEERSRLQLDDFLADAPARKANALHMIGFRDRPPNLEVESRPDTQPLFQLARDVEESFSLDLLQKNIRSVHDVNTSPNPPEAIISFRWTIEGDASSEKTDYVYSATLSHLRLDEKWMIAIEASLGAICGGKETRATNQISPISVDSESCKEAVALLHNMLGELAVHITRVDD